MNTETPNTPIINSTTTTTPKPASSFSSYSKLEETKGNATKPLSLRPNRSVKKNLSLKPLGLRSR